MAAQRQRPSPSPSPPPLPSSCCRSVAGSRGRRHTHKGAREPKRPVPSRPSPLCVRARRLAAGVAESKTRLRPPPAAAPTSFHSRSALPAFALHCTHAHAHAHAHSRLHSTPTLDPSGSLWLPLATRLPPLTNSTHRPPNVLQSCPVFSSRPLLHRVLSLPRTRARTLHPIHPSPHDARR